MIVLDANILIRAVLGRRVRQLIETYSSRGVRFFAPDVAGALALSCGIWTEDADFFGTGVAVWTSSRVEIYLRSQRTNDPGQR